MSTSSASKNNGSRNAVKMQERETMKIGLEEDAVEGVVAVLTRALADTQVFYVKTLNIHWNIVGPNFYSVHKLLDEQYNMLKDAGDEIAERIRSYGASAIGSMKEFLANTNLEEKEGNGSVQIDVLNELIADHETIVRKLREGIDQCSDTYEDEGAADLLTAHLQKHQEMSWMLRSFLR